MFDTEFILDLYFYLYLYFLLVCCDTSTMAGMSRNDSTQAMKSILSAYADDAGDDANMSDGGVDNISDEEEDTHRKNTPPPVTGLFGSPDKRDSDEQAVTPKKKAKTDRKGKKCDCDCTCALLHNSGSNILKNSIEECFKFQFSHVKVGVIWSR